MTCMDKNVPACGLDYKVKSQGETSMLMLNVWCEVPYQHDQDCPPVVTAVFLDKTDIIHRKLQQQAVPPSLEQTMIITGPKVFVCTCNQEAYVDNLPDTVDQLLILSLLILVRHSRMGLHSKSICHDVLI